ncbi:hypothetical protein IFM89_036564, partial [Coptis chinensis]
IPWDGDIVTCMPRRAIISRGLFLGDNPLTIAGPVFMLQLALSSFATGAIDYLLRPFGQCSFFSQMLGATLLGPSILGAIGTFKQSAFSDESLHVFDTFQNFGSIFFIFLVGLKFDGGMVTKSGRKSILIGISSFLVSMAITIPAIILLNIFVTTDPKVEQMLTTVAILESAVSFHVIVCLLADLKLLNSEIGRLALSSSLVGNAFSWSVVAVIIIWGDFLRTSVYRLVSRVSYILLMVVVVVCIMRPIMFWMIKRTPEGKPMKEVHLLVIFIMVLFTAFLGQATGQTLLFGPMILGFAVPPGPPLGSYVEDKLETIVSSVLMPTYFVGTVGKMKLSLITVAEFSVIEPVVLLAFLGKLIGTVLPAIFYSVPLEDALVLGLVMSTQGVVDIHHFRGALTFNSLSLGVYSIMVYSAMGIAGITSPLVKYIYQPSRRYVSKKSGSLLHFINTSEFSILACVYRESSAPAIIDLLEASNPNRESPICVNLLHLIELHRVATPLLIAHKRNDTSSSDYNLSKHIINAFKVSEQRNQGILSLNSFTAMSPYATMHEDICALAIDKRTSLIILPFHRLLNLDGLLESTNPIRNVNRNVLKRAPCSIGILIDRGTTSASNCLLGSRHSYRVAIIFLGGSDDREALVYGMRMGEHSNTRVTLIRFCIGDDMISTLNIDKKLDTDLINEFRHKFTENERVTYREEVVPDGLAIINVIMSMDKKFDLIMVGRQHGRHSPFVEGLTEWNDFPELGFLGDMLATSDLHTGVSILVLQQQYSDSEFPRILDP